MSLRNPTVRPSRNMFCKYQPSSQRIVSTAPSLRSALPAVVRNGYHDTRRCASSSTLFNLGGLSTSRESQFLSKEYRIPRTEFAPHLELIRSSEVDTQKPRDPISVRVVSSTQGSMWPAVKDTKGSQVTTDPVSVEETDYATLTGKIKGLQQQLEASEHVTEQLLRVSEEKTRLLVVFGAFCLVLSAAGGWLTGLHDIRIGKMQTWLPGRSKEDEALVEHIKPLIPATTADIDMVADGATLPDTPKEDPVSSRPGTLSGLFWSVNE